MHTSAMINCQSFFETYAKSFSNENVRVIEIGSQNINGSLRTLSPQGFEYIGVDFVAGEGVDVILDDPYKLPFDSGSADIVLSSSCFEHSEMFWITFLEILRVLKSKGLFYLNVPSNGPFHRYPVDCWRFYPDSGRALVAWAKRNGINAALLESYTSVQVEDVWNDFVAVFARDERFVSEFPRRILDDKEDMTNGLLYHKEEFIRRERLPEDQKKLLAILEPQST
ncbi:MAG: class I SAM-dependent methyltransferase [Nitrosospira sp.]|nr:class I SAM-dependent methyltransferase [Nitrosospira sp.]